jgi:glycerol-3-phosphate acyltransferase PlsX
MLGLRKVGVVAHGRFTRRGFARAIEVAARGVQEDVIGRTRSALVEAGALRAPGAEAGDGDQAEERESPSGAAAARTPQSSSGAAATVSNR